MKSNQTNRTNLPLKKVSQKTRSELTDTLINGPPFGQLFGWTKVMRKIIGVHNLYAIFRICSLM